MKRRHLLLMLLGVMAISLAYWLCMRCARTELLSPDGTLVLETETIYGQVAVSIRDAKGIVLFKDVSYASVAMRWNVRWLNNNRVILDSSDIGSVGWARDTDGTWRRDCPLRKVSPDKKLMLWTTEAFSKNTLNLALLEYAGSLDDSSRVIWECDTDITVADLADCASWDSAEQFTIHMAGRAYSWARSGETWGRVDSPVSDQRPSPPPDQPSPPPDQPSPPPALPDP